MPRFVQTILRKEQFEHISWQNLLRITQSLQQVDIVLSYREFLSSGQRGHAADLAEGSVNTDPGSALFVIAYYTVCSYSDSDSDSKFVSAQRLYEAASGSDGRTHVLMALIVWSDLSTMFIGWQITAHRVGREGPQMGLASPS